MSDRHGSYTETSERLFRRLRATASRPLVAAVLAAGPIVLFMDAMSNWLIAKVGPGWTAAIALALVTCVIAVVDPVLTFRTFLERRFRQRMTVVEDRAAVPGHRGAIVIASVGDGISSAGGAIRHHREGGRLEHCWIVSAGQESTAQARALIAALVQTEMLPDRLHLKALSAEDADNPEAVYQCIEAIYREARVIGLAEDEVIGDYTGGTKSMTAGMVLACASPKRRLQFMKPRKYTGEGRADHTAGSDPVAVTISFEIVSGSRSVSP
jgi:hypothetical protein